LTDALSGNQPGTAKISWTVDMVTVFTVARTAYAATALLVHPSNAAELSLVTDLSSKHVGAIDKKLLAVHNSILNFRHMLEGCHFTVFTVLGS
jgi:hypothetical protein